MQLYYTIRILKSISYFCSAQFLWFSYLCKLIYSIQLPSASLQLAVCCRRIHGNKDSLHPVGCRSTDNKNTPLHVNMQGASLLSDICSADAVFIKLYSARYHSNSSQGKYHQIKNADFMRHSTASISSNVTLFISFLKTLVAN